MERGVALLRILYESWRAIRNRVRNILNAADNQLLLLLNALTESLPRQAAGCAGGWLGAALPFGEVSLCRKSYCESHKGIQRGWVHSEPGKGLSIFLFPSYTAAPAAGLLAMLLVPCACLSPDVPHIFFKFCSIEKIFLGLILG